MEKVRCVDCNALVDAGLSTCPKCGGHTFKHLPLSEQVDSNPKQESVKEKLPTNPSKTTQVKSKRNYAPLVIGIVIMVIGFITIALGFGSPHSAKLFYLSDMSFGADFYTEIYKASYTMAGLLNSIDEGLAVVSKIVMISAGLVIEAIGLATVAFGCTKIKN